MNHQNEPAQLRFLEETAIRLRQSGFTVEPIEDHHLPVSVEKGRLCRISGKGSVLFRQERVDDLGAQDALQTVIDTAKMTSEYMAILEIAPRLKASGLHGDYRILADFGGAVLAGHPTERGVQFVTWDWDYLMRQRHIDRDVITGFVREKLLYEDVHHNCVFVGADGSGEAKHAHIRSTNSEGRVFRMNIEGSASEHCFHKNGTDKSLYVFEAPIDLLSHITLYPYGWQEHSYVACCGTSIQPVLERLRQNPKLDTVYLCLDNDDAGNDACDRMTDTLEDMGLEVERLCPVRKDWNDDLRAKFEKKENQP